MLSDMTPFRLVGNVYFVGTYKASCHMIDTGDGLILIDTGYPDTAEIIVDSISHLGFDVRDVKIILHSHGHYDHTGCTPGLLPYCPHAKTYLHKNDLKYLKNNPFTPDCYFEDGQHVVLGNTDILCLFTPGHTEGSMSFFFDVTEGGKTYRVGTYGGAGTNQLKKGYMIPRGLSYHLRGQFFESVSRLEGEHVDVFIGNHTWHNQTKENYEKSLVSSENPFIDDRKWGAFLKKLRCNLEAILVEESKSCFVNYAHRGASEYAPENTMLSFHLGIFMEANGIETDVQLTKDGVPVLFHDSTLERVTGELGEIGDYTYEELLAFRVKKGAHTDRIPTLEEFLRTFGYRELTFAIELKGAGSAIPTADLIRRYGLEQKCVVTSFNLDYLREFRAYAPEIKSGYLTAEVTKERLETMLSLGIDELCPHAKLISEASVTEWHKLGFNVRAWGVANREIMRAVYDAGADGMTVNFPDALTEYRRLSSEGQD